MRFGFYSPTGDPANAFKVPAVCLVFSPEDNFCQLTTSPPIALPNNNPFDAIGQALQGQLQTFEQIRQNNCGKIQVTNQTALILWLFNTELNVSNLNFQDPDLQLASQAIKGLAQGLGLYPRNLILSLRIRTLEKYLNLSPIAGLDAQGANDLKTNSADPAKVERPVQAFLSAFNTLGNHTFDAGSIRMDELLPAGENGADLLQLTEHRNNFEAYYVAYDIGTPNAAGQADCNAFPSAVPVRELPVGFSKSPDALTYYAVRLRATANLLFSPFGPVQMKAYSAAMPFGSRIGPLAESYGANPFVDDTATDPTNQPIGSCCNGVANLPLSIGDTLQRGWNVGLVQKEMFRQLSSAGGVNQGGGTTTINGQNLARAYTGAMAPNPTERGLYNIINDIGHKQGLDPTHSTSGDAFTRFFGAGPDEGFPDGFTSIWAPVADLENGDPAAEVSQAISQIQGLPQEVTQSLQAGISRYVEALENATNGQGSETEDGEGLKVVRLRDPLNAYDPQQGLIIPLEIDPLITDTSSNAEELQGKIKTSWNNVRNEDFQNRGRVGYSVKYVSFGSLRNGGSNPPDGSNPFANTFETVLGADEEAKQDIQFLKH